MRCRPAGFANQSHQPLCQNAVQCGDKVVRFDAHIEEAPDNVDHVVGVDGGENQVAGKRGLNRNLRSLGVANFVDHDLVRIVTQNGAQSAGKGQTLFLIDRDLRDAANLIFDRVLDGDDFVFVGLDLADGCVQRRGFTAPSWSRDQHHAIRFLDVAAEFAQIVFVEAHNVESEFVELLAHRFFVEYAEHSVFAVDRRHDRNAEIDRPLGAAVANAETAVLGHATLGDVQLAHHFDTRNDGRVVLLGYRRHGLREHAIDAELDAHRIVASFNVNIAGSPLQGGEDGGIDKANNRANVALLGGQTIDRNAFFGTAFIFADDV